MPSANLLVSLKDMIAYGVNAISVRNVFKQTNGVGIYFL